MYVKQMSRRGFLGLAGAAMALSATGAYGQTRSEAAMTRVIEVESGMRDRRNAGRPLPAEWFAEELSRGLSPRDSRIAAFHLVQRVPYKLSSWTGDPDSLFTLGRGDCRHKSAATRRLMRLLGYQANAVQLPFDWADLPIPESVLAPLSETRGIHDAVEVVIDGERRLVDPTWDPALGTVGFPTLALWDGVSATPFITPRATVIVRAGDVPQGRNLFDHFKIGWPVRENTLAFNRAFNAWSDEIRARAQPLAELR